MIAACTAKQDQRPEGNRYALMTQDKSAGLACRSEEIAGSATFITEPSMKARLDPKIVAVSVARGWRLGQGVALAPKAASQGLKTAGIAPRSSRTEQPVQDIGYAL